MMNYQVFKDDNDIETKNQEIREPLSIPNHDISPGTDSELSFEKAKRHQQAMRITNAHIEKKGEAGKLPTCPCCGNFISDELISYTASLENFYHLGPAIPLYLNYLQKAIYFLCVQFLIFGLFAVYSFYQGQYCSSEENDCPNEVLYKITFANILDDPMAHGHRFLDLLSFILLIVMICYSQLIAYKHEKIANEIDMHNDTPSDYAIRIRGIPIGDTQGKLEDRLKKVFDGYGLNIVKVVVVYDVKRYIKVVRRWERIKLEINAENDPQEKEELQKESEMLSNEIRKTLQEGKIKVKTTGNAFLILNSQEEVDLLLKSANRSWVERLFGSNTIKQVDKTYELPSEFYFEGKKLILEKAPEPSEIFWENLAVSYWKRLPSLFLTVFVSSVIILVGVGILVIMNKIVKKELAVSDTPEEIESLYDFLEHTLPLFTVGLNMCIRFSLKFLVRFEKPETYTDYMIDSTAWQVLIKFINSVMDITLLILSKTLSKPVHVIAGLMMNVVIANSIFPACIYLFMDPSMMRYYIQRLHGTWLAKKRKIKQEQLNQLFEYPELPYMDRYSTVYLILLLCSVFTPIVPICPLIGAFGITLLLLVDRYIITRRTTLSKDLSGELSYVMTVRYDLCIILFVISKYLWEFLYMEPYSRDYHENGVLELSTLTFLAIYIIFPMRPFFRGLIKSKKFKRSTTKYSDLEKTLMNDYDTKNPVSDIQKMLEKGLLTNDNRKIDELLPENFVKYTISYDLENQGLFESRLRSSMRTSMRKAIIHENPQNPKEKIIELT